MKASIKVLNYHKTTNSTNGLCDRLEYSTLDIMREYKGFTVCSGPCSEYLVKEGTTLTERVRVSNQLIDDILEGNKDNYDVQRCITAAQKAKELLKH
jgi:transcription elongation factor Elf1